MGLRAITGAATMFSPTISRTMSGEPEKNAEHRFRSGAASPTTPGSVRFDFGSNQHRARQRSGVDEEIDPAIPVPSGGSKIAEKELSQIGGAESVGRHTRSRSWSLRGVFAKRQGEQGEQMA